MPHTPPQHDDTPHIHALRDAALAYAARGWYVLPLHDVTQGHCSCGNEACKSPGKHPRLDHWDETASTDPAQIEAWWQQWPGANVGILTGHRSHLAVLDIDPRNGGDMALSDLEQCYAPLPETPLVLTGGQGRHYYFRLDGPLAICHPAYGIDLQADGALVVAPPSLHTSGRLYTWEASSLPDDIPRAPLPAWLLALAHDHAAATAAKVVLPGELPAAEVSTLQVSTRIKYVIRTGEDPTDPQRYRSRSEALFAVLTAMVRAGHNDATIASIALDRRYPISEKVWSQKNPKSPTYEAQTRQWLAGDIGRARAFVAQHPVDRGGTDPQAEAAKGRNGDSPDAPEQAETTWHDALLCNKNGTPQQTINNFVHAIRHLEPWRTAGYWYDVVRERHMIGDRPVEDGDATTAGVLIERETAIRVTNIALVGRALDYVCRETARDLLQEWVQTLPQVPVTDLLTTWLRTYGHVPEDVSDAYVADVSRILPVGIIARTLRPGCQYRYVPVLEGPEDAGKSKLTKALAGQDPYGTSWHVALSAGMEGKEGLMMLEGALIAELEELSSYTKTDDNRMKALITAETDSFVPKFANKRVDHPRRTVFLGTVNPEGDGTYFRGQSGNTRFLPIAVRDIDIPGFLKVRTQLFAEAKAYYLAHPDDWWQLECEEDARNEREERRQTSVYEGTQLRVWLQRLRPARCTWQEVAECHLEIPKDRWNKALQMEIAKALRAHKWIPGRTEAERYWIPGEGWNIPRMTTSP
jgi:hypothetical protein